MNETARKEAEKVLNRLKQDGGQGAESGMLYDYLDTTEFYKSGVEKGSRSMMNVVFRTGDDELDKKFVALSNESGFSNLKGHRLVGGMRASIYNSMPKEGVEALIDFMKRFEAANR